MSSDDQESRRRERDEPRRPKKKGRVRYRLTVSFVLAVLLYAMVISPWRELSGPPRAIGTFYVANVVLAVVGGVVWVWVLLHSRFFRATPAALIAILVVYQGIYVEALFAQFYYALSARTPDAFSSPLNGIDAAYFTISTATSTGMGDIHPVNVTARLTVSAQMIASLILIVLATTTAVQRVLAPAASDRQ